MALVTAGICLFCSAGVAAKAESADSGTEHAMTEVLGVDLSMTEEAEKEVTQTGLSFLIEEFPVVLQMPELPTGCEVTALTMVLNYYGFMVEKTTMAGEYLPRTEEETYYGEDGRKYGPDLNRYFVGDPFTSNGVICGAEAIVAAANAYLAEQGSTLRAKNITDTEPEALYQIVSEGIPVLVWVTISMEDRMETSGWYTEEGEYVEWSRNDHGAVLIGYTDTTVTIADPISGMAEYDREQFESVYRSRGMMSVILE